MTGKGPLIHELERREEALTAAGVAQYKALMDAQGTERYGSVPLKRAEQDARWLPSWFVLGQAADPVSLVWWHGLATTQPVGDVAWLDLECRAAWADPARRAAALATTGDDLRAQYALFRALGWHSGAPRPAATDGGKDTTGGRTADIRVAPAVPPGAPGRPSGGLGPEEGY